MENKMFVGMLLLHLVLTTSCLDFRPLPFNLPTLRYCSPCWITEETLVENMPEISGLDYICSIYKSFQDPPSLHQLGREFHLRKSHYTRLLYMYYGAMKNYERVFQEPYDFHVYVTTIPNADYCIQMYTEGQGFRRPINISHHSKNEIGIDYDEGRQMEIYFVNFLLDYWILESDTCSLTDVDTRRLRERISNFTRGEFRRTFSPSKFNPNITNVFVQNCSASTENMPPQLSKVTGICNARICDIHSDTADADPNNTDYYNTQITEPVKPYTDSSSRMFVINEFKPFIKTRPNELQFIEIRVTNPLQSNVQIDEMKIIIFTVFSKKMVRAINLSRRTFPDNGHLYLSSNHQDNEFQKAFDFENSAWLPSGDSEPLAILLIKKTNEMDLKMWEKFALDKFQVNKFRQTVLTSDLMSALANISVDGITYGILKNQMYPAEVANIFPPACRRINCILPIKEYISVETVSSSLNLCRTYGPTLSFQHEFFKYGEPTPGCGNDCNSVTFASSAYDTGIVQTESKSEESVGLLKAKIEAEMDFIRSKYNATYSYPHYPIEKFETDGWHVLEEQYDNFAAANGVLPFELLSPKPAALVTLTPPSNESFVWRVRCSICHKRLQRCKDSMLHRQSAKKIAKGFQIPTSCSSFHNAINGHLKSSLHLTTVLEDIQKNRIAYQTDERKRFASSPRNLQLANIFDITFTMLHTDSAPTNALYWYSTMKKITDNVGESLHDEETALAITKLIAETGLNDIITYLVEKFEPFTLIVDRTEDDSNNHYVLVYLQGIEGEVTSTYLLFVLKLPNRSSAEDYLNALIEAVRATGANFATYFKRRIIAVVTDSTKTMEKFQHALSEWVNRKTFDQQKLKLIGIHCLAHKLHQATRNAVNSTNRDNNTDEESALHYFSNLEKFMQNSYNLFRWSVTKVPVFRNVSIQEELQKNEFGDMPTKRWISLEYSTIKNFVTTLTTARMTLERLETEPDIDMKTKVEITKMQEQFRDKTVLLSLHFMWDLTAAFKSWSDDLELFPGLLINQYKYFQDLIGNLETLKEFASPVLNKFLSECNCAEDTISTVEQYSSCSVVTWKNFSFQATKADAPDFKLVATALVRKVMSKVEHYIPKKTLDAISILDPQNLPPNMDALINQYPPIHNLDTSRTIYGAKEVRELSRMLGMNTDVLISEWTDLIASLLISKTWVVNKQITDGNMFWAASLRAPLIWSDNTRFFVQALKTLSTGGVPCEMGLSVFNKIKSRHQQKLSDTHLECIVKILFNGPDTIAKFDSYKYAERWILAGSQKPKSDHSSGSCSNKLNQENAALEYFVSNVGSADTSNTDEEEFNFPYPIEGIPIQYDDTYSTKTHSTQESRHKQRFRSQLM